MTKLLSLAIGGFLCALHIHLSLSGDGNGVEAATQKLPTVLIATLVRNKAHTLPHFLSCIEGLNYPKDRISIWIRSDHNEDKSEEIIETWLTKSEASSRFHSITWHRDNASHVETATRRRANESSIFHWPEERFRAMMRMKEEALQHARHVWADYVFLLDADVLLTHPDTLALLIRENVTVIAPMLQSDGLYSNYWCGMTDEFYYARTEEYKQILDREKEGTFPVPMVHSAILIHLRDAESDHLTYAMDKLGDNYSGPVDDIIVFAMSANYSHTSLYVSNSVNYGYMLAPLEQEDTIEKDYQQLTNIKVLFINEYSQPLPVMDELLSFAIRPMKDRVSLSRVYMINLWRREERRAKMLLNFDALGLDVDHFPAVDGQLMNEEYLKEMNIKFLPGYADPYSKRPMTMGEIGCFLSHYFIWERMVQLGLEEVLILEDDIRFEPFFKQRLEVALREVRGNKDWDLVYLGRKRLHESAEPWVDGANYLVRPSYSYWTLGYLISLKGARKLMTELPLQKLVPVDEYLPIMFDKHTNKEWKKEFPNRNLDAFSVAPLLLFPTHYTGEQGYISDTENSVPIVSVGGEGEVEVAGNLVDGSTNNNSEPMGRIPKNNDKEQKEVVVSTTTTIEADEEKGARGEEVISNGNKMGLKENVKHEL